MSPITAKRTDPDFSGSVEFWGHNGPASERSVTMIAAGSAFRISDLMQREPAPEARRV